MISITKMDGSTPSFDAFVAEVKALPHSSDYENTTDVILDLETMYGNGSRMVQAKAMSYHINRGLSFQSETMINFPRIGNWILSELQKALCLDSKPNKTLEEIIILIVEALVKLIPGGVLVAGIIKKIADWLVSLGLASFCGMKL